MALDAVAGFASGRESERALIGVRVSVVHARGDEQTWQEVSRRGGRRAGVGGKLGKTLSGGSLLAVRERERLRWEKGSAGLGRLATGPRELGQRESEKERELSRAKREEKM